MVRPLTSFHLSRRFNKLLNHAGLPNMRYHDLRHGAAYIMAAQGEYQQGQQWSSGARSDQHQYEHLHPHHTKVAKGSNREGRGFVVARISQRVGVKSDP